jgi:hypothetical protein
VKTCKDCKFHVKYDDTTGFCYRLPPQMVDESKSAMPPVTSDKTWCGEFKRKGWFK